MRNSRLSKVIITLSWVIISQLLFYYTHFYLVSQVPDNVLATIPYQANSIQFSFVLTSVLSGLIFGFYMGSRKPGLTTFSGNILRIVGLFILVFISTVFVVISIITFYNSGFYGITKVPEIYLGVFKNKATLVSLLIWALILAGTQFMLQVNDKFGQGVLKNFLIGKYFTPREEERIFMFLDLRSSTSIAEKLGHKVFFEFIREAFKDITQSIISYKGEIYQYVGDEIIISWQIKNGIEDANCLICFDAIQKDLFELSENYQERFGAIPVFKAGLHYGSVTVGEIGVIKKDIVFSGDVLNTTARIQEKCNLYNVNLLASKEILSLLGNQYLHSFKKLGEFELRGKEQKVELYTSSDTNSDLMPSE